MQRQWMCLRRTGIPTFLQSIGRTRRTQVLRLLAAKFEDLADTKSDYYVRNRNISRMDIEETHECGGKSETEYPEWFRSGEHLRAIALVPIIVRNHRNFVTNVFLWLDITVRVVVCFVFFHQILSSDICRIVHMKGWIYMRRNSHAIGHPIIISVAPRLFASTRKPVRGWASCRWTMESQ